MIVMIAPITTKEYKARKQPTHVGIKQLKKSRNLYHVIIFLFNKKEEKGWI